MNIKRDTPDLAGKIKGTLSFGRCPKSSVRENEGVVSLEAGSRAILCLIYTPIYHGPPNVHFIVQFDSPHAAERHKETPDSKTRTATGRSFDQLASALPPSTTAIR